MNTSTGKPMPEYWTVTVQCTDCDWTGTATARYSTYTCQLAQDKLNKHRDDEHFDGCQEGSDA